MSARNSVRRAARAALERVVGDPEARERLAKQTSPSLKVALRTLQTTYRSAAARGEPLPSVWDVGFRVFSEYDEDGVILFLLSVIGSGSRRFVDIGAGDGIHASNCANLAFNLGFHGLFVDADEQRIASGRAIYAKHPDTRRRPPCFVNAFVKSATINTILAEAGFGGEVDVLSIDIDGNDYWIWEAIECTSARIVVIETHDEHGLQEVVAPYDENYVWHKAPPRLPVGASPVSMTKLATSLGYRLVGGNRLGFNAVYLRNELAPARVDAIDVSALLWQDRRLAAS